MCGITGILLDPARTDPGRLDGIVRMNMRLSHRGPDGDGFWTDRTAGIALAHRRLAIIDLSETGRQPMETPDGQLVASYNGEIYNFAELRSELSLLGHRFRGHSDTAVMLAAFQQFGIAAALPRLAGMFAIGLWDRRHRTLHLIRDRMGKKPLYVTLVNGALLFASELKAFHAFPGFQPQLDRQSLSLMLHQGWVPDQRCIWDGVIKVPPGGMISVRPDELHRLDADGLRGRVQMWWSLGSVAAQGQSHPFDDDSAAIDELDRLLHLVVRQRMVADVPLGALLSGGIDSTTVVAMMQAQSTRPVRTFTIGYAEGRYDEADSAARIARHLGTDHTELRLTADEARATIPDLPRIWDEPFADESQIPTLLVSQLARQHVTVALSGDGGDEAFGGYHRHILSARLAPARTLPPALRRLIAAAMSGADSQWRGLHRLAPGLVPGPRTSRSRVRKLAAILRATDEEDLYRRLISADPDIVGPNLMPAPEACAGIPDPTSRLTYRDMVGYLPGDILVKADRASMAVSLEGRCPLLDHRIIEFAWRLPISTKIRGGKGKWILRQVLRRHVPEALFERPKHGFDVPIADWLRGPLRDWAGDLLSPARLSREGLVDPARAQVCWHEHINGTHDHAGVLWPLLMFEAWLDATGESAAQISNATGENGRFAQTWAAHSAPGEVGADNGR
jgi:asparagine synthase (glutamine-hydrolysing)